jgi:hypothetical protein
MSRMSELAIEISERIRAGHNPAHVARDLGIPIHWVTEIAEENDYNEYMERRASEEFFAEQSADADAMAYGTF